MITFPFTLFKYWTPAQLPTSLWLDASDSSTITIATGVRSWKDKSGNGRNVAQGTSGSQPALVTNFSNSRPAIYFDGGDRLQWDGTLVSLSGIQCAFIGRQIYNAQAYVAFFQLFRTSGDDDQFNIRKDNSVAKMQLEFNTGSGNKYAGCYAPSSFNTIFIGSMSYNGSGATLHVDGGNESYSAIASGTMDIHRIIIGGQNIFNNFIGSIGELVIVNSTDRNIRLQLEGYLAWKWGLLSNLPALHPYKNIAP